MWIALLAALLLPATAPAQQEPTLTARDVGAIADVVLDTIVPAHGRLGQLPVSERGIRLDAALAERSLRRLPASVATPTSLGMNRPVTNADRSMLADCRPGRTSGCAALGQGAFVTITRIDSAAAPGQVHLAVAVSWVETPAREPGGGWPMYGFGVVVTVGRQPGGGWKVANVGAYETS